MEATAVPVDEAARGVGDELAQRRDPVPRRHPGRRFTSVLAGYGPVMSTSLQQVATGVHRYADGLVNWYLVEDGDALALVDTGWPTSWGRIEAALAGLGRRPSDVTAILLTHGHADHLGAAERGRTATGATVWGHREEIARIKGEQKGGSSIALVPRFLPHLWRPTTLGFVLHATVRGFLTPRWVKEVRPFETGEQLDVPGRPRILFTPGHTQAHSSFHFAERGVLVTGDALVTRDPVTGETGPKVFSDALNSSPEEARRSLDALADAAADVLLPGHGEPWTQGTAVAIERARSRP